MVHYSHSSHGLNHIIPSLTNIFGDNFNTSQQEGGGTEPPSGRYGLRKTVVPTIKDSGLVRSSQGVRREIYRSPTPAEPEPVRRRPKKTEFTSNLPFLAGIVPSNLVEPSSTLYDAESTLPMLSNRNISAPTIDNMLVISESVKKIDTVVSQLHGLFSYVTYFNNGLLRRYCRKELIL